MNRKIVIIAIIATIVILVILVTIIILVIIVVIIVMNSNDSVSLQDAKSLRAQVPNNPLLT